ITTKMGYQEKPRKSPNIDQIIPLGYQQAAQFYSPKYEIPDEIPDFDTSCASILQHAYCQFCMNFVSPFWVAQAKNTVILWHVCTQKEEQVGYDKRGCR
ncbi:MAG: hypothetical protein GX102_12050, partial [Porphyromonadaceae bacterium]|nr:hypothetical protein [Porphyromonadaceae bacterium]